MALLLPAVHQQITNNQIAGRLQVSPAVETDRRRSGAAVALIARPGRVRQCSWPSVSGLAVAPTLVPQLAQTHAKGPPQAGG